MEERGDQENKVFVVVLSADEAGREKDIRSFGVDGGGRYDPVRQKAERFADRINSTFSARVRNLVQALEECQERAKSLGDLLMAYKINKALEGFQ